MKKIIRSLIKKFNLEDFIDLNLFRLGLRKNIFKGDTNIIFNFYLNIVKPDYLIFDIGANRGNYTEAFAKLGTKVISVEPQKKCFDFLKARFQKNPKVILLNNALDSKEGKSQIYISNTHTLSSMSKDWIGKVKETNRFPDTIWNKKQEVENITLDSLIRKYGVPDYCKIDVEGYEYNVLKGLSGKIPLISIEFTREFLEDTKKSLSHLKRISNITVLNYNGGIDFHNPANWISPEETIKNIEMLPDQNAGGDLFIKMQ